MRVAVALWRLSTGNSFRTVASTFGIGKSTAVTITNDVIDSIVEFREYWIKFPRTIQETAESINIFSDEANSPLPQVVGAVDGCQIPIKAPIQNKESYFNRKHFYSMNLHYIPDWATDNECSDAELIACLNKVEDTNKSRFASLKDEELVSIISNAQASGTKKTTKWVVKTFEDWCRDRGIQKTLVEMSDEELDSFLWRFYAEARNKAGQDYSRSTLLSFRNAIERHLSTQDRHLTIAKNPVFKRSNKMLESKLKTMRREGKENVKHKPILESADIAKLKESAYLSPEDPAGLLRKVWFFVTLYWCRRGCEGQRSLRRDSFKFEEDAEGNEYAIMSHQERTKNHQGGLNDRPSDEILTRLYSANTPGDAYSCLKLYTSKLNPEQEAFFQRPKSPFKSTDSVWYENKPLGVNKLATMMKDISTGAGLSKIYTNHSVRATTITLLSDSSVPNRRSL
ncbi:hypothetical protein QZH41_003672 [Actinostola sp. cb2023]|nr:hypothetical protein QZH41_003672 [Actinostola sp. cb2023]